MGYSIYVSICNDLPKAMWCSHGTMAIMNDTEAGCVTLAGQDTRVNTETFVYDTTRNDGIKLHFSGGDYCDDKRDFDLTLNIDCDSSAVNEVRDM